MKKLGYIFTLLLSLFVFNNAVSAKTTMTGLAEVIEEELETFGSDDTYADYTKLLESADLSEYEESEDKVNVYIFRGSTCWHCLDEISWFASITKEQGSKFNIITYEVWEDSENSKLMTAAAKLLGETASGVPFTIIGDKAWSGFGSDMGEEMLEQINNLYNSEDRYDIKDYINLEDGKTINSSEKSSTSIVTIALLAAVLVGGIVVIYFVSKSN